MTLSEHVAMLLRSSFNVASGGTYQHPDRAVAWNVAQAAANDCGEPVGIYADTDGMYLVTRIDNQPTRADLCLELVADRQG